MGITGDEERYLAFNIPPVKQNCFFGGCTENVSSFESKSELRTRDFGDKNVTLSKPFHVPQVYLLRGDLPIGLPRISSD
jgi:hypothetical protein